MCHSDIDITNGDFLKKVKVKLNQNKSMVNAFILYILLGDCDSQEGQGSTH